MPTLLGVPLLPFRPTEAMVRNALAEGARSTYLTRDAELGWTIRSSAKSELGETNAQAIRTRPERTFAHELPADRARLVAVGDSFVHCDEVDFDDSWPNLLETTRPATEVLDFGVPGYGTDQALLRWRRDARPFAAHVAMLGIWPENLCRNVNRVRYFLTLHGDFVFKPRFRLAGGRLEEVGIVGLDDDDLVAALTRPESVAGLAALDEWWLAEESQPRWCDASRCVTVVRSIAAGLRRRRMREAIYWSADDPVVELTLAITHAFADEARATGAKPLVVLFPMRTMLHEIARRGPLPIAARIAQLEIPVLDLSPRFAAIADVNPLFTAGGHLTRAGNAIVAEEIARRIDALVPR
jgi:hypothetical protein